MTQIDLPETTDSSKMQNVPYTDGSPSREWVDVQSYEAQQIEKLWRECGLPEYFLGNGGSNHKLYDFAKRLQRPSVNDDALLREALETIKTLLKCETVSYPDCSHKQDKLHDEAEQIARNTITKLKERLEK